MNQDRTPGTSSTRGSFLADLDVSEALRRATAAEPGHRRLIASGIKRGNTPFTIKAAA